MRGTFHSVNRVIRRASSYARPSFRPYCCSVPLPSLVGTEFDCLGGREVGTQHSVVSVFDTCGPPLRHTAGAA